MARNPAYRNSSIVQNAAAASRLIVTGSSYLGNMLTQGADNFAQKTKPVQKPMEFSPATHDRVRRINALTQGAAGLSAKTVGQATNLAQNIGASMARRGEKRPAHLDKDGRQKEGYKPGLLNKSMIAFSTIADGLAYSGKALLEQGGAAATTVVGHRYGEEAGSITSSLAGGVKNVGLVYIDVTGVSRRAVIKSVAKGMVVGKVKGGGHVVVGGGDGGVISEEDMHGGLPMDSKSRHGTGFSNDGYGNAPPVDSKSRHGTGFSNDGYGNAAPPSYSPVSPVSRSGTQKFSPVSRSGTGKMDHKR